MSINSEAFTSRPSGSLPEEGDGREDRPCHPDHDPEYRGHVRGLDISELQRQVVYDLRTARNIWNRIERLVDVDVQQARSVMMKRTQFL